LLPAIGASVKGATIESHLVEGRQNIGSRENMTSCQSITDPCIGWDATLDVLRGLSNSLTHRRDRLTRTA